MTKFLCFSSEQKLIFFSNNVKNGVFLIRADMYRRSASAEDAYRKTGSQSESLYKRSDSQSESIYRRSDQSESIYNKRSDSQSDSIYKRSDSQSESLYKVRCQNLLSFY